MINKILITYSAISLQGNNTTFPCLIATLDKNGNFPYISSNIKIIYLAGFSDEILSSKLTQLKQYNNVEIYNLNLDSKLTQIAKLAPWEVLKDLKIIPPIAPIVNPPSLLGDKLEQALSFVGADKIAKVYQRITKKPCNCARRKEMLNTFHKRLITKKP